MPRPPPRPARLAWMACAPLLLAGCDRAPGPGTQPAAAAYDVHSDERIAPLLGGCEHTEPFTGDTTDLLPTLVAKLAVAEARVASRARADVIAAGRAAVPELRRAFQRWFSEPGLAPRLLALLDLAALAGGPEARAMGLEALEHPSESVRTSAVKLLAATGTPADYDLLSLGVAHGGNEYANQAALALYACDPARVRREYAGWLGKPGFSRVVELLAPSVAIDADADLRARLRADERLPGIAHTWFVASSAAAGDASALAELRAALTDENSIRREAALKATVGCGLAREALPVAEADPDPTLRTLALDAIARQPDAPAFRAQLAAGLSDPDAGARRAALTALCERGDAGAIDHAIELLAGSNEDVTLALSALRAPLAREEALARRVLARLEELLDGGARSTGHAIERAIGQVPLARAAEILVLRGRAATGTIQDLPVHRWYAVQAGNSGAAGRAWIRAQWDGDEDPVRRLDLLVAGTQEKSAEATAFLARVLEEGRATDPERLLAADYYARSVPAAEAAPVLKRAALAIATPELRRAMHCLLWSYYGPER